MKATLTKNYGGCKTRTGMNFNKQKIGSKGKGWGDKGVPQLSQYHLLMNQNHN